MATSASISVLVVNDLNQKIKIVILRQLIQIAQN